MTRVTLIALALWAALGATAGAQEFRHRGWVGAKLGSDTDGGCAMGLNMRRGGGFVVYANAKKAFKIGIGDPGLRLDGAKEALAAVTFDDGPPILLKGAPVSATTVLFEPLDLGEPGGLERMVEGARSIKLTYAGTYLRARLSGSARAIKLLRDCASAEERPETARAAPQGAPTPGGPERSVDFSFLRQGMDAGEANTRLLEAGWQADAPPEGGGDDSALKFLSDRGIAAQSCAGEPPSCAIAYADAYGNALKIMATGGGDPTVRSWRLNPPDQADAAANEAEGPDDASPDETPDSTARP